MAENRILRKMYGVPDNYGFDLEEIKTGEKKKIEDYKSQVRYLEVEVEELEEERKVLRMKLRAALKGKELDKETENFDKGSKAKKMLEDKIRDLEQKLIEFRENGDHGGSGGVSGGGALSQEQLELF